MHDDFVIPVIMIQPSNIAAFSLALFACLTTVNAETETPFVLLKSGKIVEGELSQFGQQSKITMTEGNYIVIPSEKVVRAFRTRRDIFNYRIAITPLETRAQIDLLDWLCKQKAFEAAKSHLAELQQQGTQIDGFDFADWSRRVKAKESKINSSSKTSFQVRNPQIEFAEHAERPLVLGCGLAGCHRSGSQSKYELVDVLYSDDQGGNSNAQKSEDNFKSTRAAIKKLGPNKFLEFVHQKHGPLRRAMYPKATREYLAIATWVNSLKQNEPRSRPNPSLTSKPLASKPSTIPSIPKFGTSQISNRKPQQVRQPAVEDNASLVDVTTKENLQFDFQPRDEFDPEIFNRLQSAKTRQVQSPKLKGRKRTAVAPQRLISPEETSSKN